MISCSDPTASDRMILEVVLAGASSMSELATTVQSLESQMTNMTEVLSLIREIGTGLTQVESALGLGSGAGTGGGNTAGDVNIGPTSIINPDVDTSPTSKLLNHIAQKFEEMDGRLGKINSASSGAKTAASEAANAAREIKEMLSGEYSIEAAMEQMAVLRRVVDSVNSSVENIPQAMGVQDMQGQMQSVARQIEEMAKQQGYVYEVTLAGGLGGGGKPGGVGAAGGDEEIMTVLNQNMNEVKVSLEFMQKVLDAKLNEPVVQESWSGVE